MTNVTQSQERLPCIVIIDSLHRISCGIVIIHLTIAKHRDVIFISSVGYDSSSHQPFRKEAVTNHLLTSCLSTNAFNAVFTLLVAGRWWVQINCWLNGEDTKHSRAIAPKRIVQSCHNLLSFIIQTFIALFTQRNKKRDRQMFSSILIIIIS